MRNLSKIIQIAIFIFSAQVGSGLFILPAALSTGGYKSIFILLFVGIVCTLITYIFAKTGKNTHELIKDAFGKKISNYFFLLYWIISWFSTIVLFKELIGYTGFTGYQGLIIEIGVWLFITGFNMWNFKHIILLESVLTFVKILPFFGLLVCYFLTEKASPIVQIKEVDMSIFLRCLWCFVGMETGGIMAKSLKISENERKIGTYIGMFSVIAFYIGSVFFCFYIVGTDLLYLNKSPYVTIFQASLSSYLSSNVIVYIIRSFVVLVLIGSINSWTISSGYVAYEGGLMGVLPKIFKKLNKNNVPYMGIFISSVLVLLFILLTHNDNVYGTTIKTIDISCCFFLLIYGMCLLSYGKIYNKNKCLKYFYILLSIVIIGCFGHEILGYIYLN